ncbi:hypothetical protein ISN44_As09g006100 [Arabidopsis suecica]|uniref:Secreted protein n=1 Tax=Arabidopsis suecica TaxID=45249 RepID=A0A8T2AGV6_ARASU|nr:hypothetical protein ISN44_As09g006100 [Arabidopsis suecica]KAG7572235.1 hypothetical protein ISN44_As09g006100 [Arabidopsis suecica]
MKGKKCLCLSLSSSTLSLIFVSLRLHKGNRFLSNRNQSETNRRGLFTNFINSSKSPMAKSIQYVSAISSCVGCWKSQSKVYASSMAVLVLFA